MGWDAVGWDRLPKAPKGSSREAQQKERLEKGFLFGLPCLGAFLGSSRAVLGRLGAVEPDVHAKTFCLECPQGPLRGKAYLILKTWIRVAQVCRFCFAGYKSVPSRKS